MSDKVGTKDDHDDQRGNKWRVRVRGNVSISMKVLEFSTFACTYFSPENHLPPNHDL
jgi:hypothetical protein